MYNCHNRIPNLWGEVMIQLGAHLSSGRTGYTHHGIYVGDGKVVHYSGLANGLSKGNICETTIEKFNLGRDKITVITHPNPSEYFTPIEIVKRARSRIGENDYNIIFNNCEHFATWCATGTASSEQVKRTVKIAGAGYNTYRAYQAYKASQYIKGPVMRGVCELTQSPSTQGVVAALSKSGLGQGSGNVVLKSLIATAPNAVTTGNGVASGLTAITAGTVLSGTGIAGSSTIAGIVGSSAVATAAAPVALAAGGVALVGYGAYKLWDWLTD